MERERVARTHEHAHLRIQTRIGCLVRAITQVQQVENLTSSILATDNIVTESKEAEERARFADFRLDLDRRMDEACTAFVAAVEEYGDFPPQVKSNETMLGPIAHSFLQEIYALLWNAGPSLDAAIAREKRLVKTLRALKTHEEARLAALDGGPAVPVLALEL